MPCGGKKKKKIAYNIYGRKHQAARESRKGL